MLASLFDRCMKRRAIKETDPYDWEKSELAALNSLASVNMQNNVQVRNDHGSNPIPHVTVGASSNSNREIKLRKMEDDLILITDPARQSEKVTDHFSIEIFLIQKYPFYLF